MESATAMPFGLEFVLVLAALAVVVFVACALPLIFRLLRDHRLKEFFDLYLRDRSRKETHNV